MHPTDQTDRLGLLVTALQFFLEISTPDFGLSELDSTAVYRTPLSVESRNLTTSPYSVIVIATSQHTRVMRGPTPLYSAMMPAPSRRHERVRRRAGAARGAARAPSFLMSCIRQSIEPEYLAASRPCIRLLMTSRPWKMMTDTPGGAGASHASR